MHFLVKWIKFSVKKNKTLKKYWKNGKKILEKSGNFVSPLQKYISVALGYNNDKTIRFELYIIVSLSSK